MGLKAQTPEEEKLMYEEEYKLYGRYDKVSTRRVKKLLISIGSPVPTARDIYNPNKFYNNDGNDVMNYKENQRKKQESNRDKIFRDGGKGIFKGKQREFVLSDSALNVWGGIREDALDYFKRNNIQWWDSGKIPSGHLLSSQISCVNHLYFIRQRKELATAILQEINPGIEEALILDDGYVEFEKVGKKHLGLEKSLTRGANCTSIDALMLGLNKNKKKILFLIEWKYTESYTKDNYAKGTSGKVRYDAYYDLVISKNSPIKSEFYDSLFYEPFYQMMRQTLLAWQMISRNEYKADDWMHIDVVPQNNLDLRNNITSDKLSSLGSTVEEVWKKILIEPNKYCMMDNNDFIHPIYDYEDTKSLTTYLSKRYLF